MEHDEPQSEPLEVKTFLPRDMELIDPYRRLPPEFHRPQPARRRNRKRVAAILFAVTVVSVFFAGMLPGAIGGSLAGFSLLLKAVSVGGQGVLIRQLVTNGAIFSSALLLTLVAHEMGHYLQALRYGVPASPPYFIPFPISPFGTMGAVIVQGAGVADRKQMFDIAISGPLAGLVLALPITYFGIYEAKIAQIPPGAAGISYGDPLLVQWMVSVIHRPLGPNEDIVLTPLLFAGWVGIFVTALNLIPIGQLDGGHVLYMLVGRRAHPVAMLMLWGGVGYMVYTGNYSYILIAILLMVFGPRHPPTADDSVPLGLPRIILGWITLAFIVIGFTPIPIKDHRDARRQRPAPRRNAEPPAGPLAYFTGAQRTLCARTPRQSRGLWPRNFDQRIQTHQRRLAPPGLTESGSVLMCRVRLCFDVQSPALF